MIKAYVDVTIGGRPCRIVCYVTGRNEYGWRIKCKLGTFLVEEVDFDALAQDIKRRREYRLNRQK